MAIEKNLKDHSLKIQFATLAIMLLFVWKIALAVGAYQEKIEEFDSYIGQGDRYTHEDADKDFSFRDQRIDSMEIQLQRIDQKLDTLLLRTE